MQCGPFYLPIHTHGFAVPAIFDAGAMQLFISGKLAAKLSVTIQTTMLLTIILPIGKMLVVTLAIQLDMFFNNFIYI